MYIKFNQFIAACFMISPVASEQKGSGFKPTGWLGPFRVEFACSPHA